MNKFNIGNSGQAGKMHLDEAYLTIYRKSSQDELYIIPQENKIIQYNDLQSEIRDLFQDNDIEQISIQFFHHIYDETYALCETFFSREEWLS